MRVDTFHAMILNRLAVIAADATLQTAACGLSKPQVGLLVVCNENKRAVGVVSKSDIVRHLTNVGVAEASVTTIMSREIVSCRPDDDLYASWQRMSAQNLQNMPVLATDSEPVGVLDVRDALKALFEQEEYQERMLFNYVTGVGYR